MTPGRPASSGLAELSGLRVGCVGRARPEAYPVLGEEPCRDTAYVLGMAGPAWYSRCGPPVQEGEGGGSGEQRRQEDEKEEEKQGREREKRERREKETGWERWTNRQTDSPERQAHQPPPPTPSPQQPRPKLVAPGLLFAGTGRDGPLKAGLLSHTSLQPQELALLPYKRGSPILIPLLQA